MHGGNHQSIKKRNHIHHIYGNLLLYSHYGLGSFAGGCSASVVGKKNTVLGAREMTEVIDFSSEVGHGQVGTDERGCV
jgi:hypothetical protein